MPPEESKPVDKASDQEALIEAVSDLKGAQDAQDDQENDDSAEGDVVDGSASNPNSHKKNSKRKQLKM